MKKKNNNRVETASEQETDVVKNELTVCDIIGEWGAYQVSLTLFGVFYSAFLSITLVVGPIWTPEMRHVCAPTLPSTTGNNSTGFSVESIDFASNPHQCDQMVTGEVSSDNPAGNQLLVECARFIYDDKQFGKLLTNTVSTILVYVYLKALGQLSSCITFISKYAMDSS